MPLEEGRAADFIAHGVGSETIGLCNAMSYPMVMDCMLTNQASMPHTDLNRMFNTVHEHEILAEILFFEPTLGNRNCSRDAITKMANYEALATASPSKDEHADVAGQFQLQFVTTVSVNVPSKAEKKRNQKIIRQTVMKNFRQQQRSEKLKPKGKNNGVAATSSSDPESGDPESDELSSNASRASSRSQSNSLTESDSKNESGCTEPRRSSSNKSLNPSDLGSPLTPLGAGRVDPFRKAYADDNCHMHELIDHCKCLFAQYTLRMSASQWATTDHDLPQL
jgi:hypothetical protein